MVINIKADKKGRKITFGTWEYLVQMLTEVNGNKCPRFNNFRPYFFESIKLSENFLNR